MTTAAESLAGPLMLRGRSAVLRSWRAGSIVCLRQMYRGRYRVFPIVPTAGACEDGLCGCV